MIAGAFKKATTTEVHFRCVLSLRAKVANCDKLNAKGELLIQDTLLVMLSLLSGVEATDISQDLKDILDRLAEHPK